MGSRSNNGGEWPSDGGSPDDLPDLPEEWGVIVIPDDLSELADEVASVQAELHRARSHRRWRRFAARPSVRRVQRIVMAGVRAPVLIISMAVLVTVASLFASAWPSPSRAPATQRTAGSSDATGDLLPALELIGADGAHVPLRAQKPAVILLTDGCRCTQLIADTIAAVPRAVEVVTVISVSAAPTTGEATPPTGATPQAQGKTVLELRDPTGALGKSLQVHPTAETAAAVLVDHTGLIVRTLNRTASVLDFQMDLARL